MNQTQRRYIAKRVDEIESQHLATLNDHNSKNRVQIQKELMKRLENNELKIVDNPRTVLVTILKDDQGQYVSSRELGSFKRLIKDYDLFEAEINIENKDRNSKTKAIMETLVTEAARIKDRIILEPELTEEEGLNLIRDYDLMLLNLL